MTHIGHTFWNVTNTWCLLHLEEFIDLELIMSQKVCSFIYEINYQMLPIFFFFFPNDLNS